MNEPKIVTSKVKKNNKQLIKFANLRFFFYPLAAIEFILIIYFMYIIVGDTFPVKFSLFSLLLSLIATPVFYKIIFGEKVNKKVILSKKSGIKNEIFYSLLFTICMTSLVLFFTVDTLLASLPDKDYKVFVLQKWKNSGRSNSYDISVSSWRKDKTNPITLSTESNLWNALKLGDSLSIQVRQGGLGIEKIKSMKKLYPN